MRLPCSDGKEVVLTDDHGRYKLPAPTAKEENAGISIFITKPGGYEVPVDEYHVPQFFYHHKPAGSPDNVRGEPFRFGGLAPTGPLPRRINFPLIKGEDKYRFKVVVSGDTQPYSNTEVGYVRHTLAKELAGMNDLAHVPADKLIVLNFHIPVQTYIDQEASKHQIDNALELYDLLGYGPSGYPQRPALALSGHTHTLEQLRPGEVFAGWEEALGDRSPGAVPFPQIVTGAACGSWWSADFSDTGVPFSYQRLGGPRGYLVLEFEGNTYKDVFKATGKPVDQQMSLSVLSPTFTHWSETLISWLQEDADARSETPPVNINDLPDTKIVTTGELGETYLMANVWNGSRDSKVYVQIDGGKPIAMERTQAGQGEGFIDTPDPFALKLHLQVARYAFKSTSGDERAQGFELFRDDKFGPADPQPLEEWLLADQSMHLWQAKLPADLEKGIHVAKVGTTDIHGNRYEETMTFEVMDERPSSAASCSRRVHKGLVFAKMTITPTSRVKNLPRAGRAKHTASLCEMWRSKIAWKAS